MTISRIIKPGGIFILILYSLLAAATTENLSKLSSQNYILILSSCQYENPYTTRIAKEVQHQLEQENPELIFRTVYASLDVQQTPLASRLNMQKAFSQARLTPEVLLPRILILIGDESWMLYRIMNLRGIWGKVPVVLCGVHEKILKDYADFFTVHSFADSLMLATPESTGKLKVTGVLRDNVSYNMAAFIHQAVPAAREIIYISNGSYCDEYAWQEEKQTFRSIFPGLKLSHFNLRHTSADSIQRYTGHLSPDSALLLFNTQPSFITSLPLPAFSIRDGGDLNKEVVGGYYTTSGQLAQQTAKLVSRIYTGTPVYDLPFQYLQNHRFYLNAQAPHLHNPHRLEEKLPGVIRYNLPAPFMIRHIRIITPVLLLLSISIISITIYRRSERYRRNIRHSLQKYKALHEKFRIIYDHMPVALLLFDDQGKLLHKNAAVGKFQAVWQGYAQEHLNLFDDLLSGEIIKEKVRKRKDINQVVIIQQGKYRLRPSEINHEDCSYFRMFIRYIPDETCNSDNILVMLIDNTAIYQEKIAHKRIRTIFNFAMNKASIGVAEYNLCDQTGIATDSYRSHLNIHDKQIHPSTTAFRHVVEEDRKAILGFLAQASQGKKDHFSKEVRVTDENGTIHHLREQFQVMEYHPAAGRIQVTDLNQNIDKEKEFATEMQAAIEKAREAERLKNTFIANMSHEIRSPLNAIVGFSNLMIHTADLNARQEMIHLIEESNETLLRLINDIIDLSKIQTGSMSFSFSEIDINTLFQDLTAINQGKAKQKLLSLECHCPEDELYILTDKIRIRQVISNFLSNALKFTDRGKISLGYRLEKDELYVYVNDTGTGISAERQEKVFERFFRAHNTRPGYGLGLSISRSVIEGLGGTIGVESEEGRGSTFWFRLPAKIVRHTKPALSASQLAASRHPLAHGRAHILIVEDDESNFLLLQFMLKDSYHLIRACNGEEAVELFRKGQQDLILMDIKLPKKNGYEATEEIRALSLTVPIIATTAYAFSKDETRALNHGFNAYLSKPLNKQLLLQTINYWLNNAN